MADKEKPAKKTKEELDAEQAAFNALCEEQRERLTPLVNHMVAYEDEGTRFGYLLHISNGTGAVIQPLGFIGGTRPDTVVVSLPDIRPRDEAHEPTKYPTIADFEQARGWKERKAPEPRPERVRKTADGEPATDRDVSKWSPTRAVELFKQGMKIIDIAVEMGYPRGSGCNRTKAALKKAGVL